MGGEERGKKQSKKHNKGEEENIKTPAACDKDKQCSCYSPSLSLS